MRNDGRAQGISGKLESRLARRLMLVKEGERLPSIRRLAESTHASVGAVSEALNGLQRSGVVRIEKRGHLGSTLCERSQSKLWHLAEREPLVIAFSLPLHLRFEGLATGLKRVLSDAGISAYFIFIRGSRTRLAALRQHRCHVAVLSGFAADELCGRKEEIILRMPPMSWLGDHTLFYRVSPPDLHRPLRVAVDRDSFDHQRLSELEFAGQDVEFVYAPFVQFPRLLRSGEIDATVWTLDQSEAFLGPGIHHRPLSAKAIQQLADKSISATFVARRGSDSIRALFDAVVDGDRVLEIQRKVLAGQLIAEY